MKRICTFVGIAMIAAAALLASYNLWDDRRAGKAAGEVMEQLNAAMARQERPEEAVPADAAEKEEPEALPSAEPTTAPEPVSEPAQTEEPSPEPESEEYYWPDTGEMATVALEAGDCVGTVTIPRLGRSLPVMSRWSYPLLKKAPCRYSGSIYTGDMVIAGHNYRSHFGGYRTLRRGDKVYFTDVYGNRYAYRITATETVRPTDIEEMITGDDWDMTLFTCTNGGKARFAVRCVME